MSKKFKYSIGESTFNIHDTEVENVYNSFTTELDSLEEELDDIDDIEEERKYLIENPPKITVEKNDQ